MNDKLSTILIGYDHLPEGTTAAGELCPACRGGTTKERTFSVSKRDGRLLWKCHRNSCGFKGSERTAAQTDSGARTKVPECRGVVGRTILRNSEPLAGEVRKYLLERYGIREEAIAKYELGWDTETNRLCLPVQDFLGNRLGVNLRALDNRQPKTKLHAEDNALSWYVNHTTPDIIIVEDQFSAIRFSDYLCSVALLGTHLNEERLQEIKKHAKGNVFLALDKDAWAKAVGYSIKYRSTLKLILLRLNKDGKDMSNEEMQDFVNELIYNR
jgi:hypothetical protein